MQLLNIDICRAQVKKVYPTGVHTLSTYILHDLVNDKGLYVHLLLIHTKCSKSDSSSSTANIQSE